METDDYINLWRSHGIQNVEDYVRLFESNSLNELISNPLLSKDGIYLKNFWAASIKHFGINAVCGVLKSVKDTTITPENITRCNNFNGLISSFSGIEGFLRHGMFNITSRGEKIKMCEIGPGFGLFRDFLSKSYPQSNHDYTSFDINPLIPEAVLVKGSDGTLSEPQLAYNYGKYNMVVCFNVFQHLYYEQVVKYIDQISYLLSNSEYSCAVIQVYHASPKCNKSIHYGQVIDLPEKHQVISEINKRFKIISHSETCTDGFASSSLLLEKLR